MPNVHRKKNNPCEKIEITFKKKSFYQEQAHHDWSGNWKQQQDQLGDGGQAGNF